MSLKWSIKGQTPALYNIKLLKEVSHVIVIIAANFRFTRNARGPLIIILWWLHFSMCLRPVSCPRPTPSLNTWRCPFSLPLLNNCTSVVWTRPLPAEVRPVCVTTRRCTSNWIQKSGTNLSRKGLVSSVLPFEVVTTYHL